MKLSNTELIDYIIYVILFFICSGAITFGYVQILTGIYVQSDLYVRVLQIGIGVIAIIFSLMLIKIVLTSK